MAKVALVHDWLVRMAGAERVLECLCELFPEAPVHALVWDGSGRGLEGAWQRQVRTSFLQRLPGAQRWYSLYLPLMPLAVESLDVSDSEVVISSSHAVAKGVRTRPDQLHISYVHTPMRYAWDLQETYVGGSGMKSGLRGLLARMLLHYLRMWDVCSASRVDVFVANSYYVARRIWKNYRRESVVIYPPVDVERFEARKERADYYVTVTRLVAYKRVDVLVEAFRRLGRPLVVIGDGPELRRLRRTAPRNVQLLGWQPENVVREHLERAKAFVFAAEEDFGIAPVEAQAAGAPVVAFGRGGVTESVIAGETGLFFYEQTPEAVVQAVLEFERSARRFGVERMRENAERFRKERFKKEFSALVEREWTVFQRWRRGWGRPEGREKNPSMRCFPAAP